MWRRDGDSSAAVIILQMQSESEVAQSCPTLWDPMDCSPPGSSVHGILQASPDLYGNTVLKGVYICIYTGFSSGSAVKNPPANAGDMGLIPG